VNNLNELTNATRTGPLTVAGLASAPRGGDYYWGYPDGVTDVTVGGTGLTTGNAELYGDGSWAKANATLADGNNTYTATAKDTYDRTASDSVTVNLPPTNTFSYDGNGNLTGDGRRVFEYDFENQLTNVYVASAWRSEFKYDAFGRRRVRKEYTWKSSAWTLTCYGFNSNRISSLMLSAQ
jgi:YD repeat-containing protein